MTLILGIQNLVDFSLHMTLLISKIILNKIE